MAIQSVVAVGFILLSVCIAAGITRYRVAGHVGWIIAAALVALGGVLALWLAQDWAGWLTATLFILLIASPLEFLVLARRAAQSGQWKKAAHLQRWAALLHPSPWTRFGAAQPSPERRRTKCVRSCAGADRGNGRSKAKGTSTPHAGA
jgi:ABC-type Fe3+ transport system permease subunit